MILFSDWNIVFAVLLISDIKLKPSSEATHFAPDMWSFERGILSPGLESNTFMSRFTSISGLYIGIGCSSG